MRGSWKFIVYKAHKKMPVFICAFGWHFLCLIFSDAQINIDFSDMGKQG